MHPARVAGRVGAGRVARVGREEGRDVDDRAHTRRLAVAVCVASVLGAHGVDHTRVGDDLVRQDPQRVVDLKRRAWGMGALRGGQDVAREHRGERLVERRPDVDPLAEGAAAEARIQRDGWDDAVAVDPALVFAGLVVEVAVFAVVDPQRQRVVVQRHQRRELQPLHLGEQRPVVGDCVGVGEGLELVDRGRGLGGAVGEQARPLDRHAHGVQSEVVLRAGEVFGEELAHARAFRERLPRHEGRVLGRDELRVADPLVPVAGLVFTRSGRQRGAAGVTLEAGRRRAPEEGLREVRLGVVRLRLGVVTAGRQDGCSSKYRQRNEGLHGVSMAGRRVGRKLSAPTPAIRRASRERRSQTARASRERRSQTALASDRSRR